MRRGYPQAKLARLTAVKDAYDPGNVFHLNHYVAPTRRSPGPGAPVTGASTGGHAIATNG